MRVTVIAVALSALVPVVVAAQQNQAAPSAPLRHQPPSHQTTGAAAEAPVGHRQPNAETVPSAVRHEESGRRVSDPLGPLPQLCRDC
ncbi:MAG: hypothetical protein OJF62_000859 [Pseudolabrys sp.]|jgi:hypothetical protein|nr:hypothetical protein [Pseudolabrys sp.]